MKTQVCLVLLGVGLVSASAYAAHMEETPMPVSNDLNVTAPDQSGAWSFGATAVFMQPTNDTFVYTDVVTAPVDAIAGGDSLDRQSVKQDYYWWFGADVTYAFAGNSRDVTLAYEGLHGDTSASSSAPGPDEGSSAFSPFTGRPYLDAYGETKTAYDAGDLVFGQKLKVGPRIDLHPFVGLRYAHLDVKDMGDYTGVQLNAPRKCNGQKAPAPTFEDSELDNTFNGIGPRFGSDAQINLGQGFSVHARLGLSVLIGSSSIDESGIRSTIATRANPDGTPAPYTVNSTSQTSVIPEIDGRLGLNYTYHFNSNTALGLEAGWQATNYFNVITGVSEYQTAVSGAIAGSGAILQTTAPPVYNFGMQGPYARLQLDIA